MPKTYNSNIASGQGQGAIGKSGLQGPAGEGFNAGIDLTGSKTEQVVVGLRRRPISPTPPTSGQVYVWNGVEWKASSIGGGGGLGNLITLYVSSNPIDPDIQNGTIGNPFTTIQQALDY